MINWNATDARQVERVNDAWSEENPTLVRAATTSPSEIAQSDEEKSVRVIALLAGMVLTAIVVIWRNPDSLLWWFLVCLVLSSWCCALGSFITDILQVATEWMAEALAYLRRLLMTWRDAVSRFVDRWIWSRFRTRQTTGEQNYVEHN